MIKRIYQIVCIVLFAGTITACVQSTAKETELHENLVNSESEFWFQRSISHVLLNRIVSKKTQVVWSTNFHTAAPVPIGAVGPEKYTKKLQGIIQNDSIGRVLKEAVADNMNVILVIGDGMGNMHMALPVYKRYAEKNKKPTMFEQIMKEGTCGYVYTGTSRGLVTGSAASGTAIACGQKTLMNMIGVDSTGMMLESAMSLAKKKNYKTALVTDAGITDATPAAFYAHIFDRDLENRVAMQLLLCDEVDVIFGGGASRFIPKGTKFSDFEQYAGQFDFDSSRKDSLNLIEEFKKKSYQFCCSTEQLEQLKKEKKVLGLFAEGGLPAPINRDSSTMNIPTVKEMGEKALELISNNQSPYFAMIECARIDWEAHDNDIGAVYEAVEDMNRVLESAYAYYKKDPEKTLLIFTSDHETGGLEIAYRKMPKEEAFRKKLANGDEWINLTNPLSYKQYLTNLNQQKKTVSKVLSGSHSTQELKQNIHRLLGFKITDEEAELLLYSMTDYKKYKD